MEAGRKLTEKGFVVNKVKFDANIELIVDHFNLNPSKYSDKNRNVIHEKVSAVINSYCEGWSIAGILPKELKKTIDKIDKKGRVVKRHLDLIESAASGSQKTWNNDDLNAMMHSLFRTKWELFFNKKTDDKHSLSKYYIEFQTDKDVNLIAENKRYSGTLNTVNGNNRFLTVELNEQDVSKEQTPIIRRMYFYLSHKNAVKLEGFMLSFSGDVIYNNQIVLRKIKWSDKTPKKSIPNIYYSKEYFLLEPDIREYFKHFYQSRMKTTDGGLSDSASFQKAINIKNEQIPPYQYDLYISAPITSLLSEEQFTITQKIIEGILGKLKNNGLFEDETRIYSPATAKKDNQLLSWNKAKRNLQTKVRYKEAHDKWLKSENYMLVLPFDVPSVAFIQASWVFLDPKHRIKKSVFFVNQDIELPSFMDSHIPERAFLHELDMTNYSNYKSDEIETFVNQDILAELTEPEIMSIASTYGKHLIENNVKI